jgi:hypothetical protein
MSRPSAASKRSRSWTRPLKRSSPESPAQHEGGGDERAARPSG